LFVTHVTGLLEGQWADWVSELLQTCCHVCGVDMYIRRKYPMWKDAVTVPPQRYQLPLQIFLLLKGDALATGTVFEEQSPHSPILMKMTTAFTYINEDDKVFFIK
jgi:hypothetical protein